MADRKPLHFTPDEMARINACRQSLGTSFADFIRFATMRAVDECEGLAQAYRDDERRQSSA
jgi:hypothetical protein